MQTGLAQTIVTIAGAIGLPAILYLVARGLYQQVTGRAARERARNSDYLARSIRDSERADISDITKRKALEYASQLRGEMLEKGITPTAWPEDLDRTLTPTELRKLRRTTKTKENP